MTCQISIQINDELLPYRVFDEVMKKIFNHLNEDILQDPEEIEDTILDNLPIKCSFNVGYGTNSDVISQMIFI